MFRRIFANSLIYAIGPQIPQVVSIILLPFLTPHLTPKDYGIYGTLIAYLLMLGALKDLGFSVILSNTFFNYPKKYLFFWTRIFTFISLWACILALLMVGLIYFTIPSDEFDNFPLIALCYCIPVAFFDTTRWICNKYFQLHQKPLPSVAISVASSLAGIAANVITIKYFNLGYLGWFIAILVVSIVSFVPSLYILLKIIEIKFNFNFNLKWLKPKLKISLPVLPHVYSSYLLDSSDRVILNLYNVDINSVGVYNIAYTFGGYYSLGGDALASAAGPAYMELYSKNNQKAEAKVFELTVILQFILLLVALLISIWFKEIFQFLIKNPTLAMAYSPAILILMSYAAKALYFAPVTKLSFIGKTKELWKISFAGGIINIILNIILVPYWGIWGSIMATYTSMMYLSFAGYFLKSFKEVNKINYHPFRWLIVITVTTVFCFLIKDIAAVNKLYFTTLLVTIALIAFKKYRKYIYPIRET